MPWVLLVSSIVFFSFFFLHGPSSIWNRTRGRRRVPKPPTRIRAKRTRRANQHWSIQSRRGDAGILPFMIAVGKWRAKRVLRRKGEEEGRGGWIGPRRDGDHEMDTWQPVNHKMQDVN